MSKEINGGDAKNRAIEILAEEIIKQFPKILQNINLTFDKIREEINKNDEIIDSNTIYLFSEEVEKFLEESSKNISSLSEEDFHKYNSLISQRIKVAEAINDKINLKQKVIWQLIAVGAITASALIAAGLLGWLSSDKLSEGKE